MPRWRLGVRLADRVACAWPASQARESTQADYREPGPLAKSCGSTRCTKAASVCILKTASCAKAADVIAGGVEDPGGYGRSDDCQTPNLFMTSHSTRWCLPVTFITAKYRLPS